MDEQFPPSPEQTERHLRQVALRELLSPVMFEPITRFEWRELRMPHPEITQL